MSSIQDSAMHIWVNGETITQDKLEQNRKVFETAINDNQSQISAQYTNAQIDAKVNTAASTTKAVQAGTVFPTTGLVDGQEFYRDDLHIMYIYDAALNKWVDRGSIALQGFKNLLDPSKQSFTRASNATRKDLTPVPYNVLRTEQGRFGQGAFIEEATTEIVQNNDFEVFTGTATVFSDNMTAGTTADPAWTTASGSFTWSTSGATSGAANSLITAGNIAWKPLTGSNGTALSLTIQATFTEPTTVGAAKLQLWSSNGNFYHAFFSSTTFAIEKWVGGTGTALASVAQTISASSTQTITLALTSSGGLTAKLYSGVGTGGTLLQTLTATDTSLTGGFLIGVGGDTGVVIKNAQVTAPFADGWTIGGDQRVAWALTSSAISGSYSMSGVGVANNVYGYCKTADYTYSSNTSCTVSGYVNSNGVGSGGAWIRSADGVGNHDTTIITGTVSSSRYYNSYTTASTATHTNAQLFINDSGTATFDAIQLEQKPYPTAYLRNDSTSASASRNADSLSYTLSNPLSSRNFGALVWTPEYGSANSPTRAHTIFKGTSKSVSDRYGIEFYNVSDTNQGKFRFFKSTDANTYDILWSTNAITFNSKDRIFVAWEDDQTNGQMYLWVGINGGTLNSYSMASTKNPSDVSTLFVGNSSVAGYEANGTIDFPILTDVIPTADQVQALYQASDWGGVRHWPLMLTSNQQARIAPTLLSGWGNYNNGFMTAGYYKDELSEVHIDGYIANGTTADGTILFYLPVGCRPSASISSPISFVGNYTGRLSVGANGAITIAGITASTWVSIKIPSFRAEQ